MLIVLLLVVLAVNLGSCGSYYYASGYPYGVQTYLSAPYTKSYQYGMNGYDYHNYGHGYHSYGYSDYFHDDDDDGDDDEDDDYDDDDDDGDFDDDFYHNFWPYQRYAYRKMYPILYEKYVMPAITLEAPLIQKYVAPVLMPSIRSPSMYQAHPAGYNMYDYAGNYRFDKEYYPSVLYKK
ncbi:hypothetical protein GWI33_000776 [Rhynchophorus ferrugineus]|uniref:Uncharacterized protein n=1 Tax=Rhynchophorus ferrugineus TaxID=354439 RepID=A0A834HME7_RHYFE|nr:hypothetical protein GWI33_000776 [Rhynchophorus ferrugineus]